MPSATSAPRRPLAPLLAFAGLLAFLPALAGLSCGPSPERVAADREEIEAFLGEYLPRMAEAYRTGDTEPLAAYAAEKERDSIERMVRERAQQGTILAPELRSVEVEDVRTWQAVNAYVTTLETWNIRVLATGSESVVREEEQENRVKYQMKREDGRWRVFWRELEQAYTG